MMRNWSKIKGADDIKRLMRIHHLSYMIDWDSTHKAAHRIEWPSNNLAAQGLVDDILSGRIPITESLMRRLRGYPQIRVVVLRAICLKTAGVKSGKDAGSTG